MYSAWNLLKTYITICYYYKVGLPYSEIPEGYHGNQPLLN